MTETPVLSAPVAPPPGLLAQPKPRYLRQNGLWIDEARAKDERRGYTIRPTARRALDPTTKRPVVDENGMPVVVLSTQLVSERRQQTKALRDAVPGKHMSGRQLKKIRRMIKEVEKKALTDHGLAVLMGQVREAQQARLDAAEGVGAFAPVADAGSVGTEDATVATADDALEASPVIA